MTMCIVAIGQDSYWLAAVHEASMALSAESRTYKCLGDLQKCIPDLPEPSDNTLILLDAAGQTNIETVVASLRSRGWKYVITVASDPSAKEATSVLRRNLGYDYWAKTYDKVAISESMRTCFEEIIP